MITLTPACGSSRPQLAIVVMAPVKFSGAERVGGATRRPNSLAVLM